ncbi:MAG: putative transposase [Actinoplanes sp.]|nr:putative transposase [Actinoplanes sp.]
MLRAARFPGLLVLNLEGSLYELLRKRYDVELSRAELRISTVLAEVLATASIYNPHGKRVAHTGADSNIGFTFAWTDPITGSEAAVDTAAVVKKKDPAVSPEGVDAELVGRLVEQARAAGLQLTGEDGLLRQLTKRVIEAAMDGGITDRGGLPEGHRRHAGRPAHHRGGPCRLPARWWSSTRSPSSGVSRAAPTTCTRRPPVDRRPHRQRPARAALSRSGPQTGREAAIRPRPDGMVSSSIAFIRICSAWVSGPA